MKMFIMLVLIDVRNGNRKYFDVPPNWDDIRSIACINKLDDIARRI